MQIHLRDREMPSYNDMERYIKSLAAIYERHWLHVQRDGLALTPTVRVFAPIPLLMPYPAVDGHRFGALQAILEVGQPHVDNDNQVNNHGEGFHCQLFEGWGNEDVRLQLLWQHGDFLGPPWSYPCSDAPAADFWYIDNANVVHGEF